MAKYKANTIWPIFGTEKRSWLNFKPTLKGWIFGGEKEHGWS